MTTTTEDRTGWLELPGAPPVPGLRFRRPRDDDAEWEATAAVVRASNTEDDVPWLPSGAHLREEMESSPGCDLARDVIIAEVDGSIVGEGGVDRVIRDGVAVYEVWGHVAPGARRRGIGRAMLHENLRRAAERGATEPAGQAWEFRAFVEESEIGHRAILEAAGFVPIRWFFLMRRPTLDDIPEAPLPDGLELRPVTEDQHRAIWEAESEAFRDHWSAREPTEEEFEVLFRREDLDTSLWVVAWDGGEVAAIVQNWVWTDENERLGARRGWLEHISVRRPWRRRGVGRAVTAESLRRLADVGMTEAMLGVDAENPTGALGLYEGLGFAVHHRAMAFRRPPVG